MRPLKCAPHKEKDVLCPTAASSIQKPLYQHNIRLKPTLGHTRHPRDTGPSTTSPQASFYRLCHPNWACYFSAQDATLLLSYSATQPPGQWCATARTQFLRPVPASGDCPTLGKWMILPLAIATSKPSIARRRAVRTPDCRPLSVPYWEEAAAAVILYYKRTKYEKLNVQLCHFNNLKAQVGFCQEIIGYC